MAATKTKAKKAKTSTTGKKVIKRKPATKKGPAKRTTKGSVGKKVNRTGKLTLIEQKARQRLRTGAKAEALVKLQIGSKNDCVSTPPAFVTDLEKIMGTKFKFDPCPANASFDGLKVNWKSPAFVNPPYSSIKSFIEKAIKERDERSVTSAFLIPARTDSVYWREIVWPNADQILFLKGRIVFQGYSAALPLSMAVVIFRPKGQCHKVRSSGVVKGTKYEFVSLYGAGHIPHIQKCPKPKDITRTKSGCGIIPLELVNDIQSATKISFKSLHSSDWNKPWSKTAFVAPTPAGVQPSVTRAIEERKNGNTTALLIPVRSDTKYWHSGVFAEADQMLFLTSHIHFCGQAKRLPVPFCVAIYRPHRSSSRGTQFISGSTYNFVSVFPPSK